MNEYRRQAYLSALGLDGYMPRWRLPWAPEPTACVLPQREVLPESEVIAASVADAPPIQAQATPAPLSDVLRDIQPERVQRTPLAKPLTAVADALAAGHRPEPLAPFSLSIWRAGHLLIIAERQPRSALPTEQLVHNLVRALGPDDARVSSEEILNWPMVEQKRLVQTREDARIALQTWLETEVQQHPVNQVWLMGSKAAEYFLPDPEAGGLWKTSSLVVNGLMGLVLPDLVSLLRDPSLKRRLWLALSASRTF